jgi:hypothetical protein
MPTLLATHTSEEMKGAGKATTSIPTDALGALIIQFNNGNTPGYFTMEQDTGRVDGAIPHGTNDYAAGSFSSLTGLSENNIIVNRFKFSVAVPPGTSSMIYGADIGDGSGAVRLRGTSDFNLQIFSQ